MQGYRIWAEVNLQALKKNIAFIKNYIGNHVRILAVVKADAYGHGAVPVAYKALESGCHILGVGDSSEAIELRESGITGPILILGAIIEEEISEVVKYDIQVAIHSKDLLSLLSEEAKRQCKRLKVHLKIDTGMTRLGVPCNKATVVAQEILNYDNLELRGLFTHFSSVSSGNLVYTNEQLSGFKDVIEKLKQSGLIDIEHCLLHAANSAALFTCMDSHLDMVRTGIALYGLLPGVLNGFKQNLEPILSLKSRIVFLKSVSQGTYIGYDQRYQTKKDTLIATCPVGYNDGYPYQLTNKAFAIVRGCKAPVVGSISMDYIMLDVGELKDVRVGDEVTLIGQGISVEELAAMIGTIPYELTCRLGKRIKRIIINEPEQSVASADSSEWRRRRHHGACSAHDFPPVSSRYNRH